MIRRHLATALRWLARQLEGAETVTTHHPVVVVDDEALAELLALSRVLATAFHHSAPPVGEA